MNTGKSSQLGKHGFRSLHNVTIIRTSCFDTDFASQMKLTTLPLMVKPVFKTFYQFKEVTSGYVLILLGKILENISVPLPHQILDPLLEDKER